MSERKDMELIAELVPTEVQLELLGEVLDRAYFFEDLLDAFIEEPIERFLLDAHQVGKREHLVELGERDPVPDRNELVRQRDPSQEIQMCAQQGTVDGTANEQCT